jgi:hypothetical protein
MALSTTIKNWLNFNIFNRFNLYIETLTSEKRESQRIEVLDKKDYFDTSVFPVPECFASANTEIIFEALSNSKDKLAKFQSISLNDVDYTYKNDFYSSPDAEVLYIMLNITKPRLFLEIGSGNSTKIARQSIKDHGLSTKICSVDPQPRTEIDLLCDEVIRKPVESMSIDRFSELSSGDILFIDSSHKILPGNDVTFLYLNILPILKKGVIIHIHDIFLPFEYPKAFIDEKREWNEQYLVQVLLETSKSFEVLWPGHFLQRTQKDFGSYFDNVENRSAQSLWLRKV